MDPSVVTPVIGQQTRDILVPAAATGFVYLILSGQMLTFRIAVGALISALTLGYFGTMATVRMFHLGPEWYSICGAGFGFIGHLALLGIIRLGKSWEADPRGFLAQFLPFIRRQ